MNKQYLRADDYVQDFNDHAWHDFHEANINDQDDFYDYLTQWIDDKVTYTFDARNICDNLEADVFAEHDLYGRANNWSQAGYNALYDCLTENDDTVTWTEMEHVLNESQTKIAGVDFTDSLDALKKL
mgnify:FL=1